MVRLKLPHLLSLFLPLLLVNSSKLKTEKSSNNLKNTTEVDITNSHSLTTIEKSSGEEIITSTSESSSSSIPLSSQVHTEKEEYEEDENDEESIPVQCRREGEIVSLSHSFVTTNFSHIFSLMAFKWFDVIFFPNCISNKLFVFPSISSFQPNKKRYQLF